ncbi:MAG: hypothetical protein FJ335_02020 [Sphingomonadales bacterium]|nr:hypothetical protein [Sphingomonadales bacterium]
MERESGDFSRDDVPGFVEGDDTLDRLLAGIPPAPAIKHVDEPTDDDDAAALADIAAGRFVTQEQLAHWARSVGTSDYRPMPREWLE